VKGAKRLGIRVGNWLTAEQGKRLLLTADIASLRGKRDYATLAILLGCGLRRAELTALRVEDIQQREEHRGIADLIGKGGHIRTIPVPDWVKVGIDSWTVAAGITTGTLLRSVNKAGRIWGTGFSPKVIWGVVKQKARDCETRLWPRTTSGAHAPVCAIRRAGNWSRFSFCWVTFRCRRPNATWAANSDFATQSTIELVWSQTRRDLRRSRPAGRLFGTDH
jgi:hypothetical protein